MLARVLIDLKNFDEALNIVPESGEAFVRLRMRDPEGAMRAWEARDENYRKSKDGLAQLFYIHMEAREFDKALGALEAAKPDLTLEGELFWGSPNSLDALDYVYLMQKLGRQDEAERVLTLLDQYIKNLVDDGLEHNAYIAMALTASLRGDAEGTLGALLRAEAEKEILWYGRDAYLLEDLKDRPEIAAVFDRSDAHVNRERAELGWDPVE